MSEIIIFDETNGGSIKGKILKSIADKYNIKYYTDIDKWIKDELRNSEDKENA